MSQLVKLLGMSEGVERGRECEAASRAVAGLTSIRNSTRTGQMIVTGIVINLLFHRLNFSSEASARISDYIL